jgi:hypothetical protein
LDNSAIVSPLEISQAEAGVKSNFAAMRNTESNLWDG